MQQQCVVCLVHISKCIHYYRNASGFISNQLTGRTGRNPSPCQQARLREDWCWKQTS